MLIRRKNVSGSREVEKGGCRGETTIPIFFYASVKTNRSRNNFLKLKISGGIDYWSDAAKREVAK